MTSFLDSCKGLIRSFVGPTHQMPPDAMDVDEQNDKKGIFAQSIFVIVRGTGINDALAQQVCGLPIRADLS